jgi:hypothetical protein
MSLFVPLLEFNYELLHYRRRFDPDGEMPLSADPMTEYLSYFGDVRGGAVGDMGFTLDDLKRYYSPDWPRCGV